MFDPVVKKATEWENKVRNILIKSPMLYGLLAAVSFVLFWKGVDETAALYPFLTGPVLILISVPVLIVLGVFLPFFVNDKTLLHKLKNEEDLMIKKEQAEQAAVQHVAEKIEEIDREMHEIEEKLHIHHVKK